MCSHSCFPPRICCQLCFFPESAANHFFHT
jgi:uncharacterized OB-fold protein